MGLSFSYLLYFERKHLWDAVQGLVAIAEHHEPPVVIQFPDRQLSIPLDSWLLKDKEVHHDDPEFSFDLVLRFELDDEIEEYLGDRYYEDDGRSPPEADEENMVYIGYIYLGINNDLSSEYPDNDVEDLVLFDFGTTGTRMSLLFSYSQSIRKTFTELLEKHHGICGVFNREYGGGEVFWFKGRRMSFHIENQFLLPDEINALLEQRNA
jgi:hypothetical protein